MWPIILLRAVGCVSRGLDFCTWQQQRNRIRQLERSKEEIQIEETLVFDFLHGLGEAFTETIRPADLHRLIVEGAARILDAHGGALYMMDRTGGKLAPAYISKGCPPLVEVPADRFCRKPRPLPRLWRAICVCIRSAPGEGMVGRVWQTREPVCLTDLANAPELAQLRGTSLGATSVMVTPLLYGKQNMGVLALGNGPMSAPFTPERFRCLQIDRRAIGLRALQRHHLLGSE